MNRNRLSMGMLICAALLFSQPGCSTLNLNVKNLLHRTPTETSRHPVVQIVCVWHQADGFDKDGLPAHGFAGSILFLNNKSESVKVNGEVRVYMFDNQGTPEEQSKPIFLLTDSGERWNCAFENGPLGPSYCIFIPYPKHNVQSPVCSIRVRYTPKDGSPVLSEVTKIELTPGVKKNGEVNATEDTRVEQTIPIHLGSNDKLRKTTSISLTPPTVSPPAMSAPTYPIGANNGIQMASYDDAAHGQGNLPNNVTTAEQQEINAGLQSILSQAAASRPLAQSNSRATEERAIDQSNSSGNRFKLKRPQNIESDE